MHTTDRQTFYHMLLAKFKDSSKDPYSKYKRIVTDFLTDFIQTFNL